MSKLAMQHLRHVNWKDKITNKINQSGRDWLEHCSIKLEFIV